MLFLAGFIITTTTLADTEINQDTIKTTQEAVTPVKSQNLPSHEDILVKYANLYGASSTELIKVVRCESGFQDGIVGDSGRSIGVAQFARGTFTQYSKQLGEKLDYNSSYDQLKLMSYMFSINKADHWTAHRALKNGGEYTFYSSFEQRWITSYCK